MKWSLMELKKYREKPLEIDSSIDLSESLLKRDDTIIAVSEAQVKGKLVVNEDSYQVDVEVNVLLTLPSSRSLSPVVYPMNLSIDEKYMVQEAYNEVKDLDGFEHVIILESLTLNLAEAIEDYILLNIPLQVLTEEEEQATELPKGESWTIISEEDYYLQQTEQRDTTIDPRLAKLSTLLDNNEEKDKS